MVLAVKYDKITLILKPNRKAIGLILGLNRNNMGGEEACGVCRILKGKGGLLPQDFDAAQAKATQCALGASLFLMVYYLSGCLLQGSKYCKLHFALPVKEKGRKVAKVQLFYQLLVMV